MRLVDIGLERVAHAGWRVGNIDVVIATADVGTEVVDDDAGPLGGEVQRVETSEAVAGARDDGDATVEAEQIDTGHDELPSQ